MDADDLAPLASVRPDMGLAPMSHRRCIVCRTLRVIMVAVAVMALPGTVAAQRVQGGIKAGIGFSNVTAKYDPEVKVTSRMGLVAGGLVTVNLTNHFAIQPEVLFVNRGNVTSGEEDGLSIETRLELDYIDVPLLARIQVSRGSGPYLLVGPSINFNQKAVAVSEAHEGEFRESIRDDLKASGDIRGREIGVVVGGGVEFAHFLIEARYSAGLTSISQKGEKEVMNRSFAALIGFRFP